MFTFKKQSSIRKSLYATLYHVFHVWEDVVILKLFIMKISMFYVFLVILISFFAVRIKRYIICYLVGNGKSQKI